MWFSGNYGIEIQMTQAQADSASHQGDCNNDVEELAREPKIARQLAKIDPAKLRSELKEYGAWDEEELSDHDQNLIRILWLAAGQIKDEAYEKSR